MVSGKEWLTNRELRVELIGLTQIVDEERLTEEELDRIISKLDRIIQMEEEILEKLVLHVILHFASSSIEVVTCH